MGMETTNALDGSDAERPVGVRLSPDEYAATRAKLTKLRKRADKRGLTGGFDVEATPETWSETLEGGVSVTRSGYRVRITGQPPQYAGWRLIAAVDTLKDEAGRPLFVLRCAPGVDDELVDREALVPGQCDHCRTARANRRRLFLVQQQATGEYRQVGASCLKDFLGHSISPVFISVEELQEQLFSLGGSSTVPAWPVDEVLTMAEAVVEHAGGYVSVGSGSGVATKGVVEVALCGRDDQSRDLREQLQPLMAAAAERAVAVKAALLEAFTEPHGYEANMRAALSAEFATPRELGLLASASAAYRRLVARDETREARQRERESTPDAWLGQEGEKLSVQGRLTTAMTIDGYAYGTTQRLLVLRTDAGVVKMITAASWAYDVDAGDEVTVSGTVKAHDTYRELKQTVLKRPRLEQQHSPSDAGDPEALGGHR